MQSEVESKALASHAQTPQNLALDMWEGKWRVAKGSLDNISVSEPTSDELQDLLKHQVPHHIFATEESKDVLAALMRNGKAVNLLPRLLAIYWSLGAELKNEPCIVISVGASHTTAGLIEGGNLVNREESIELSVRSMWARRIESNAPLRKLVKADLEFNEKVFQGVLSAMRTGTRVNIGANFFVGPQIDFAGSLEHFKSHLESVDPDGAAKLIVLSDWGATSCNLEDLLGQNGRRVLRAGKDGPFAQAVSGLMRFSQAPVLKLDEEEISFPNATIGQPLKKNLRIQNVGAGLLQAQIIPHSEWLKANPSTVVCGEGEERTVLIEVNTSGFQVGSSHPSELEFQWPVGTRTEIRKIKVQVTTRSPFPCCPNEACRELVLPENSPCPQCSAEAAPASLELWIRKRAKPALKSDLISLLKGNLDLMPSAEAMGFSRTDAEARLDREFEGECGVNRETLLDWVVNKVERIGQAGAKTNSQEQVESDAGELGILQDCYQGILKKLAPPKVAFSPEHLHFRFSYEQSDCTQTLTCRNVGGGILAGTASAVDTWLEVNPKHLDGSQIEQTLDVVVRKADLPRGEKISTSEIHLHTSGGLATIPVDVRLLVADWRKIFLILGVFAAVAFLAWYLFLRVRPIEGVTFLRTLSRHDDGGTSHDDSVSSLAFSPDGATLASGSADYNVILWDAQTWRFLRSFKHRAQVRSVAFSPDGKTLASATEDKVIRLWDAQTLEVKQTLYGHDGSVEAIAFSPDGKVLVSGGKDKTVRTWDVRTGHLISTLTRPSPAKALLSETSHADEVTSVAFSPDGRTIASGSADSNVILWDAKTGEFRRSLKPKGQVRSVAFSPDGKLLASADSDKTITLWAVQTGERKRMLTGHDDSVESLAFLPDGKTLASAGKDKTVRIWDVDSGELRWTLAEHSNWVCSVIFSSDGKTLASAGKDHTVKVWELR
ncbi:MAG: WD40 repeat domain-containing protein [Acidobacteriota bacterium]